MGNKIIIKSLFISIIIVFIAIVSNVLIAHNAIAEEENEKNVITLSFDGKVAENKAEIPYELGNNQNEEELIYKETNLDKSESEGISSGIKSLTSMTDKKLTIIEKEMGMFDNIKTYNMSPKDKDFDSDIEMDQ